MWVGDANGRQSLVGQTGGELAIPPCQYWWVQPAVKTDPELLAHAVVAEELSGLALQGGTAAAQLDAVLAAAPPDLRYLALHETSLTPRTVERLAALPALERLSLRACPDFCDSGLGELAVAPALRALDLVSCDAIDGRGLRWLARGPAGSTLTSLGVRDCQRLGESTLEALSDLPALEAVQLGADHLGEATLEAVVHAPALTRLELSAPLAAASRLSHLSTTRLTSLHLHLPSAPETVLIDLLSRAPGLRSLTIVSPSAQTSLLSAIERLSLESLALRPGRPDDAIESARKLPLRELELLGKAPSVWGLELLADFASLVRLRFPATRPYLEGCPCCKCAPNDKSEVAYAELRRALPECSVEIV